MGNASKPKILILGSIYCDIFLHVSHAPAAGETLTSTGSATYCGGKGANQAVACARLGADVAFLCRVGDDPASTMIRAAMTVEGIAEDLILPTPETPSGTAIVILTPDGQNRIILIGGANAAISPADVAAHEAAFAGAALMVCQMEIPLDTAAAGIAMAGAHGVKVVLNPAPAVKLPREILGQVDYLIPNESEAAILTGIDVHDVPSATAAALWLRGQGARNVIVTLGGAGILIADEAGCRHMPALPANVVDTTGAGDSFTGGFVTGLGEGLGIDEAAMLGLRVARICVSRNGAQASLPRRDEI
jgi:ribokinase